MEWEAEGGKGLLWVAVKKVCAKEKLLVYGNDKFLRTEKKGLCKSKALGLCKKAAFSIPAKSTDKEKLFFSTLRQQFLAAPKLTCNRPFQIPLATVSLQQNNPFSKLCSLAFALRLPFRTDSNPHRRYPERLRSPAPPVT